MWGLEGIKRVGGAKGLRGVGGIGMCGFSLSCSSLRFV